MPVGTNRIHLVHLFEVTDGVLLDKHLLVVEAAEIQSSEESFLRCANIDVMRKLTALTQLRFHNQR